MTTPATAAEGPASLLRKAWRIFYWFCIVAGAWGIIQMLRVAPAPQVALSAEAERSAAQKLSTLAVWLAPSPAPAGPQRIALTQEELGSYLAAPLALAGVTGGTVPPSGQQNSSVRDLKVTFAGDRARLFVLFHLAVKDLTFQLEGHLHVEDGYLHFEITDGSLGYLSLPAWALDQTLSRLLTRLEIQHGWRVPAVIRDIRAEDGELVIERQ